MMADKVRTPDTQNKEKIWKAAREKDKSHIVTKFFRLTAVLSMETFKTTDLQIVKNTSQEILYLEKYQSNQRRKKVLIMKIDLRNQ